MYRIRFHGRGGQGVKTAGRILGAAFFAEGFEVQDAPRYGAERRGAPIFAYVRASRSEIFERGVIACPDLVVVADPTLVPVPAAGCLLGVGPETAVLLRSEESVETWRRRLNLSGPLMTLPGGREESGTLPLVGGECAGAAAKLLGCISRAALEGALRDELMDRAPSVVAATVERGLAAYDALEPTDGAVREGPDHPAPGDQGPGWIDLPFEGAGVAAPDIHAAATSVEVRTGLWRTLRPVVDLERCNRCHWVCSTLCPDGAIAVADDGHPVIDYDHCKGCMICVAVCPPHAIHAVAEADAQAESATDETT